MEGRYCDIPLLNGVSDLFPLCELSEESSRQQFRHLLTTREKIKVNYHEGDIDVRGQNL